MAHPPLDLAVTLSARTTIASGIVRFEFTAQNDVELPEAEAGAHIRIQVPNGEERQ